MADNNVDKREHEEEEDLPTKQTCGGFLWNPKEKTVLGRNGWSWLKITVFYAIFYACLAAWFTGLLHVFYESLESNGKGVPKYYGHDSLVQNNPGLGVRPMPLFDRAIIRFHQGQPSSYAPYTEHLRAFFGSYENVTGAKECRDDPMENELWNMRNATYGCKINVAKLLSDAGCGDDYGYFDGEPCVAIKMNKLYNFTVDAYQDKGNLTKHQEELSEETKNPIVPDDKMSWAPGRLGVSCQGSNAVDNANIRGITFAPDNGINPEYFPYMNQQGYRAPLMIAKLNVNKHTVVQIVCQVWAKNIDNSDGQEKHGTVHFELLID